MSNEQHNNQIIHKQTQRMTTIDFSGADQFIEAPYVRRLEVSDINVHDALWPTFKQLLATTTTTATTAASGWKYETVLTHAVNSIKKEYKLTTSDILEDIHFQYRVCFYFIMTLYH